MFPPPASTPHTVLADVTTTGHIKGSGEVSIRVRIVASAYDTATATVRVTMLPDRAGWWSCPDAATRRRLVDRALRGTEWRRSGEPGFEPYVPSDGWVFLYALTREEA